MAPTTPTGTRRVSTLRVSVFSATWTSSVCLAISWHQMTEPPISHSAPPRALPCSVVKSRMKSSACAWIASPILATIACRSAIGRADQAGKAALAAATAASSCSRLASGTVVMISSVAGLIASNRWAESAARPLMVIVKFENRSRGIANSL
jgi:hypothetical protein